MSNLKIMLYFCMLVGNNALLNILLPNQDNKVIKDVLKEADSKALNSMLKNSGSVQGVLKELFNDIKNGTKSNETITNILKNSSLFKEMGSFTGSLKALVAQLQNDDSLSKYKATLQSFLTNIDNLDESALKELLGKSGVFLEAKILASATQSNVPTKLQDLLTQIRDLIKNINTPEAKQANELISKLLTTPNQSPASMQTNLKEVISLLQNISKNLGDKNVQNLGVLTNQLKALSGEAQLLESKAQNNIPVNLGDKQQLLTQTKETLLQLKNEILTNKNVDPQNLAKQIDTLLNSRDLFSNENKIEPKNLLNQLMNSAEIKKEAATNSNISNLVIQLKNISDQIDGIEQKINSNQFLLRDKMDLNPQIKETLGQIRNELLSDRTMDSNRLQNTLKSIDTLINTKDLLQSNNVNVAKSELNALLDSPALKNAAAQNPKLEAALNNLRNLVAQIDEAVKAAPKENITIPNQTKEAPATQTTQTNIASSIVSDKQVAIDSMQSKIGVNASPTQEVAQQATKLESNQVITNEKNILMNQLKETLHLLKNELNISPNNQTSMLNQIIDKLTGIQSLFDKIQLPANMNLTPLADGNLSTFQSNFSSNLNSLLLNLKETIANLSLNPQAPDVQTEILKLVDKIETSIKEGVLTPANLAKNEPPAFNNDMKNILLQMQEEIASKVADPRNMEMSKTIDKLLFQVDYYQLLSLSSNSSYVYLPFLWDMLEEGSIGMKKLNDKKFYCEINLTLKDFGKVELLLAMYDKNKLDLTIFAARDSFKKLVREELTKLKQSLNGVGLIPMNIKLIDLKEPQVEKKEEKTNIYAQSTDIGFGIDIKA